MVVTRVNVCGVSVDCVDFPRAAERAREFLRAEGTSTVLAVNPEKVFLCRRNPALNAALEDASLLIPDGIGVVLAARVLHRVTISRVPGCELMPALCAIAAEERRSVFLFGGAPGVAERAASVLLRDHPSLQVVGVEHGFIGVDQTDDLIDRINRLKPGILFVGMGTPRQEKWIREYRSRLDVKICQGVGGTFDVLAGDVRRAPKVFRMAQLEWFYRLLSQPSRAKRQLAYPVFIAWVLRELVSPTRSLARRKPIPP